VGQEEQRTGSRSKVDQTKTHLAMTCSLIYPTLKYKGNTDDYCTSRWGTPLLISPLPKQNGIPISDSHENELKPNSCYIHSFTHTQNKSLQKIQYISNLK
jgi:hypothetical protein